MSKTRGTKISSRHLGEPRFVGDPETRKPGEVTTYKLSKEEIEKLYPSKKVEKPAKPVFKSRKLTKDRLTEELKTNTVCQVAVRYYTSPEIIMKLVELHGLKLDNKNRLLQEGEKLDQILDGHDLKQDKKPTKMDIAREKLPKEKLVKEFKTKGIMQIAREYDLAHWQVQGLLKQYGLRSKKQEKQNIITATSKDDPKKIYSEGSLEKLNNDNSNKAGQILKILYPNGVTPEEFGKLLAVTKAIDNLLKEAADQ